MLTAMGIDKSSMVSNDQQNDMVTYDTLLFPFFSGCHSRVLHLAPTSRLGRARYQRFFGCFPQTVPISTKKLRHEPALTLSGIVRPRFCQSNPTSSAKSLTDCLLESKTKAA